MANEKKTPEQARYQKLVKERMPKSRTLSQCIRAFISGGIICCIGQLMRNWAQQGISCPMQHIMPHRAAYAQLGTAAFTAIVMVFLGATLTGIGVYDKIGEWSGAGSIVPITGFANSIVSPAMEFKREGFITGTAAKLFTIAGPVLVYGVGSSVIVGLLSLLFK